MRTKDTLLEIADVAIFYQYLYMDKDHKITFNNDLTNLTLSMNDSLHVMCRNCNFPDLPPSDFSDMLTLPYILAVIDRLKDMPATEFPSSFKNRWEEIKTITQTNLTLNISKYR
jgi:hypothetical protein